MRKTRKSTRIVGALLAVTMIAAACGGDDGDSTEAPTGGGTLVWAHEQEPPDLHLDDPSNNLTITSWIRQSMWEGLFGITGSTEFFPELLAGEPEVVENADGSVTANYVLRDGLQWSDGESLTSADVEYTYNMVMATDGDGEFIYLLGDRTGLDSITDFTVSSDTEFSITWSDFFAGWKGLFAEVHPSHIFPDDPAEAAAAANEAQREWVHNGEIMPSSGPMIFESWTRGVNMRLVRNDNYHGSVSPDVENGGVAHVEAVQLNFVTDTDSQILALQTGEADFVMTQPQLPFEVLVDSPDFTIASLAGPVFEHWGLNLNNVHLSDPLVREAFALAMDKSEVMEGLYTPLFPDALPPEGLGNTFWLSNQSPYVDNAGNAGYGRGDIDGAIAKLEEAGYALEGGVMTHPDRGRLELRVGTTGGNVLRELQQELLQDKFSEAGIIVTIDNVQGAAYFGERPFADDAIACAMSGGEEGNCDIWDITQFAWVGGPWPGGISVAYRTGSGNNPYGFQNAEFDALADQCDSTVDDAERADCYNELDKFVTTLEKDPENGLFMLPLTQKPSFYAYSNTRLESGAVAPDANSAGPLVNVVDFKIRGE